jgi:hypothetical protein
VQALEIDLSSSPQSTNGDARERIWIAQELKDTTVCARRAALIMRFPQNIKAEKAAAPSGRKQSSDHEIHEFPARFAHCVAPGTPSL